MKTRQAELWERLTSELGDYDFYNDCETPRAIEIEDIFDKMCKKFSNTLTPEQQDAFRALMDIDMSVHNNRQDTGITLGLHMAYEMQKLLSRPSEARRMAETFYPSNATAERYSIQTLNDYFSNHDCGGDD